MKRLCIIPARGGSKRLPGKNIKELAGKPLILHTMDIALECFEKIIFSSDSNNIRLVALRAKEGLGEDVLCDLRPKSLAADTSKVIDTVRYYFDRLQADLDISNGNEFDQIWLCLPTCPLRTKTDVEKAQALLTP